MTAPTWIETANKLFVLTGSLVSLLAQALNLYLKFHK